jgi:hypothetical protein
MAPSWFVEEFNYTLYIIPCNHTGIFVIYEASAAVFLLKDINWDSKLLFLC